MKIAFVITPQMLATSTSNAYELLFAADQVAKTYAEFRNSDMKLVKVAQERGRISLSSGLSMSTDESFCEKNQYDMVYLPALWRNPRPIVRNNPALIDWIRYQYEHGAIINATGTGVCFLAEAGLLNDKPATTHWHYFEQFARDYPTVRLKRQHFITNAERLYCAASINALTDLTLHHVHRFFNKAVSDHLSRHFSHEVRQPFDQLNYSEENNTNHPDEVILQAQLWMQNNCHKTKLSIQELSALFGMSQRNFARRFKAATNLTPVQYLQDYRIKHARELLQNSNLSIKEIAYRVGYIDVSYFTKLFKDFSTVTPKQYRTSTRAKLFSSQSAKRD